MRNPDRSMTAVQALLAGINDLTGDVSARLQPRPARGLVVLGAHGGAGTSTVTALLDIVDPGLAVEARRGEGFPRGRVPVLVARSTASGLSAAGRAIARWPGQLARPWLVVVADAPFTPPFAARFRLRALAPQVAGVVQLPYVHRLRAVDTPNAVLGHTGVAKATAQLAPLLEALR